MERLTTDAPNTNLERALNLFYAKDGEAWVLRGGSYPAYVDVTLFDYIRSAILNNLGPSMSNLGDEELGEVLSENWLFDGNSTVEGLISTLYTAAWAFAELRARLKSYEDTGLKPEEIMEAIKIKKDALAAIARQSTVDAVEVVRCKDCGRHGKITLTPDRMLMCVGTPDCGYCHDAIRKEWKSND